MTIRIRQHQRIVLNISVKIERLRVAKVRIRHRLRDRRPIRTRPPPLRPTKIPCPKVIEARLGISFFAGKTDRHFTVCFVPVVPTATLHSSTSALSGNGPIFTEVTLGRLSLGDRLNQTVPAPNMKP